MAIIAMLKGCICVPDSMDKEGGGGGLRLK